MLSAKPEQIRCKKPNPSDRCNISTLFQNQLSVTQAIRFDAFIMKKRVLTGINTTGTLHIGNYVAH